jgi:carbonic anhydrase
LVPSKLPKGLVEGYRRFLRDRHAPERARYRQLAELGQAPTAMVIACCDARVDVATVFDAGPGELFVLRNVANLVPPYEAEGKYHGTSAAIEFAILTLRVPHLIVLGHSRCGGVAAYRQTVRERVGPELGFIGRWLTLLNHVKLSESEAASDEGSLPRSDLRLPTSAHSPSSGSARRKDFSDCMAYTSTLPVARSSFSTRGLGCSGLWLRKNGAAKLRAEAEGSHAPYLFFALP